MAGQDRAQANPVALFAELQDRPHAYDFFAALRLLECAFADRPRLGTSLRLKDDAIRLGQAPSLAFAPSTLASFQPGADGRAWRLGVHFFGMFGPNGALPLHLTEYARDRHRHEDDPTFVRFLDIFHHRLLCLFFGRANAEPTVQFDRPDADRFSGYVGTLMGLGMPSLRDRDDLPDLAKLHYAGRLACQTRNPEGLRAMIADFFDLPVQMEEFIGQWTELPEECRLRLGQRPASATLGVGSTIGSHVWDCQQRFRITMGPLSWKNYCRLLPGGDSLKRFTALVRNYIGDELIWELNLILRREETPPWTLGEQQIGRAIWLDNEGLADDPRDLKLQPDLEC